MAQRCRGRPRKHDWESLFQRGRFTYLKGRDYTCSTTSVVQQIRNAASKQGISVAVIEVSSCVQVQVKGKKCS